jgi:hypothetical protein
MILPFLPSPWMAWMLSLTRPPSFTPTCPHEAEWALFQTLFLKKKKARSAGNRTRGPWSVSMNFDHYTAEAVLQLFLLRMT